MRVRLPICSFDREEYRPTPGGDEVLTISADLQTGPSLRLYEGDHIMVVSFEVPREEIVVLAHPEDIDVVSMVDPGIERAESSAATERYDIRGTILKTDAWNPHGDDDHLYVLDVGIGRILVRPLGSNPSLESRTSVSKGDAVHVRNARLEFYDDSVLDL